MAFLLIAFTLSRLARWSIPFTVVTLICGTIPFLSFWAEFRAIHKAEAQLAEADAATVPGRAPGA